jgi:hypothetical protein
MHTIPKSSYEWVKASFISFSCISVLSLLATRAYGDLMILNDRWRQLASVGDISTLLLLLAAVVSVFVRQYRRLALLGFFVTASYFLVGIFWPSGGIRF